MAWLHTRWQATYQGHRIAVSRNEWNKGFSLEWDGKKIARRRWSWLGVGKLRGTADLDGRPVEVEVAISFSWRDPDCTIAVDGEAIPVTKVK